MSRRGGTYPSTTNWWERSPNASNATNFCNVNSDGTPNNNNASNTYGVAFGFCEPINQRSNLRAKPAFSQKERMYPDRENRPKTAFTWVRGSPV